MTHELPSLVTQLGWTLVHSLWQGAMIAALYALAGLWLRERGPEARYAASIGALAAMALAPIVTFLWLDGGALALDLQPTTATIAIASAPGAAVAPTLLERLELAIEPWLPALVLVWMIGVAFMSTRLWSSWRQLAALRRSAIMLDGGELRAMVVLLRSRLGVEQVVRVARSTLVEAPTVIGWLQPIILVPTSALTGLSPTQLAMIFAHELAHIRRHDYLVNVLQTFVETLLFFHPAVRWISERARQEREECCDRLAVEVCGDPLAYARALAELEELRGLQVAWGLGAAGGELLERIERLLGQQPRQQKGAVWLASSLGLAVLTTVVATAGAPYLDVDAAGAAPVVGAAMISDSPRRLSPLPERTPAKPSAAEPAPRVWVVPRAMPRESMPVLDGAVWQMPSFDDAPAIEFGQPEDDGTRSRGRGPEVGNAEPVDGDRRLTGGAIVRSGEPEYPNRALRRNIEGHVVVEFTVDETGVPRDPQIVAAAPFDMFENAALKAVTRTRFEPFRLDGTPVSRRVKQYISFNIAAGGETCEPMTGTRLCKPSDRLSPRSRGVEVYVIR